MEREKIKRLCAEVSRRDMAGECSFISETDDAAGFIDTSSEGNGSRGIVFFSDKMLVNIDGSIKTAAYSEINSVHIISGFEDNFADELEILGERLRIRISDYSLDKHKLKSLIELMMREAELSSDKPFFEQQGDPEDAVDNSLEDSNEDELYYVDYVPVIEEYVPEPITEEKINWLSDEDKEEEAEAAPEEIFESSDERELISEMSHEETLSFLTEALDELAAVDVPSDTKIEVKPETAVAVIEDEMPAESPVKSIEELAKGTPVLPLEETRRGGLTVEPMWGDIYIKASRSLRELCESGRLSMERIENELRLRLLDTAKAFADITADEGKIPKVLVPRIAELKNAADNFDEYFSYGEDIAVRAMFFMLYQMLSYSDRIAETPETKERLNDFFRYFGTAGITLSMLDKRF